MGFAREELRRALWELRATAEKRSERTQAHLQRQVRHTRLPGTERFHGQRASEWAAATPEDFRLPKNADVLLAVVAVWLSWTGQRTLDADGRVRPEWLRHPDGRSWRNRYDAAVGEANESRQSRDGGSAQDARTDAAVAAYLQRLVQTHRSLNMDVLGEAARAGEQPQIGLREVFEAPLLAWEWPQRHLSERLVRELLERGEPGERDMPKEATGRRHPRPERPPQPVLDVLGSEDGRRLVVLGDPGAGKTTLAKYLALALAEGLEVAPYGLRALRGAIPIVVELRRFADPRWIGSTVEDYWAEYNSAERMGLPREVLDDLLTNGRRPVVMVFDGLDEVFDPARRADIARHVTAFAQSNPHTRVVVTSRLVGFRAGEFSRADFRVAKLQDLTRGQIDSFIGRWYAAAQPDAPAEAARLARRLTDAVRDFPSVAELAGNPLLLTILAAIGLGASIPRDRRDVYEHAVTVLAGRWDRDAKHLRLPRHAHPDVAHALDELDGRTLQELLECIAARMQEGTGGSAADEGPLIALGDLERMIRDFVTELGYTLPVARTVARAMVERLHERAFLIHPFGAETYGFVHRTFLEYLAARDLSHRCRQWDDERVIDFLADKAVDSHWREVILLFLGMISRDAEALHARFIARLLRLHRHVGAAPLYRSAGDTEFLDFALQVLAEARRIGRPPVDSALTPQRAESSLAVQSDAVVDAVTALLTVLPGVTFPRALVALPTFPRSWSGRERFRNWFLPQLVLSGSPRAAELALAMCRDAQEAMALARVTWNETGAVAARVLGRRWAHEAGVRETVNALASDEKAVPAVRAEALRTLAGHYAGDPCVRSILFDAARAADLEAQVRIAAVNLVAKHWSGDPETRSMLLAVAHEQGAHADARIAALRALARQWPEDSEVRRAVLGAVGDPEARMRWGAWKALAEQETVGEEVRPLALTALGDVDPHVRQSACKVLAARWPQEDEVRKAVFAAVRKDRSDGLFASLSEHWAGDREAREILFTAASNSDLSADQRHSALWALADQWPDDEEVRRLMFDLTRDSDAQLRWQVLDVMQPDEEARRAALAATGDVAPQVRQAALEISGWEWPGHPEIRQALLSGASDDDSDVRWFAVETLAQRWPQDEDVRQVLLAAVGDADAYVRTRALLGLGERWPEDPEAQRMVLAATSDPDSYVRSIALQVSSDRWPGDRMVREIALKATHDAAPEVVLTALCVLAQRWPDDPESRSAVERCVDGPVRIDALRLLALVWPGHETLRTIRRVRQQSPTEAANRATSQLLAFVAAASSTGPSTGPESLR